MHDSEPRVKRRTLITATGSAGAIGLAGCLGDDDDPDDGATDNEEAPGDDDGESGDGDEGNEGEAEFDRPDFVESADSVFGRMEADWDEGEVTTELRIEEELEDPDEASEIMMLQDGEELGGGSVSSPIDLPIAEWSSAADAPLIGDITVEVQNDFGDSLASMEWHIDGSIEVLEAGIPAENADWMSSIEWDEDQFYNDPDPEEDHSSPYLHVGVEGHVAYISNVRWEIENYNDPSTMAAYTPADDEYSSFRDLLAGADYMALQSGEAVIWLRESLMLEPDGECVPTEGEIVLERPEADDIMIPVEIEGGEEEDVTTTNTICTGGDIHIAE